MTHNKNSICIFPHWIVLSLGYDSEKHVPNIERTRADHFSLALQHLRAMFLVNGIPWPAHSRRGMDRFRNYRTGDRNSFTFTTRKIVRLWKGNIALRTPVARRAVSHTGHLAVCGYFRPCADPSNKPFEFQHCAAFSRGQKANCDSPTLPKSLNMEQGLLKITPL